VIAEKMDDDKDSKDKDKDKDKATGQTDKKAKKGDKKKEEPKKELKTGADSGKIVNLMAGELIPRSSGPSSAWADWQAIRIGSRTS
jgi:hypothetical protein